MLWGIMSYRISDDRSWWRVLGVVLLLLVVGASGLNVDGIRLLSLKYSVLSDPLSALEGWNYRDETPCSWNGVTCSAPGVFDSYARVVALALSNCRLLGSIPASLGMMEHLQKLDLSNNSLNGSLPLSIFNASQLQILDLSNNLISGELPDVVTGLQSLVSLNLSDNALAGKLPANLSALRNLTDVSLKNNYFSGGLPSGFDAVETFDLSSNLINGSLPSKFGGDSLRYFNISYNRISGEIPPEFAEKIPENATIDLSYNNLTGEIPEARVFFNQQANSLSGNPNLCGKPLKNPCPIQSQLSLPPNMSDATSPPAIAAIPRIISSTPVASSPGSANGSRQRRANGLRPVAVAGIVLGDLGGIAILALIFLYIFRKKKTVPANKSIAEKKQSNASKDDWSSSTSESRGITAWSCLRKTGENEETSETTSSDSEADEDGQKGQQSRRRGEHQQQKTGVLVTVDGEKDLELETLLKASAYILGATGSSIMYRAVLEDGTALAVRRIGESSVEKLRDFETQVRAIAKLVHPNLIRLRGFYWGVDEKLIIYDYVPNGSLANARYRKMGSSPCHLPWEVRLKVARGVARGLSYLHEKKHVHGNLKPSNILLGLDMEPRIGDFGLDRLVSGENTYKVGGSMRNFGSKRSTASRDSFQDQATGPSPSPSPSSIGCGSPYHAPESLRSLKPNSKWDVYSFGTVLLELLTGKVVVLDELGQGTPGPGPGPEEKNRVLRMADVAIRADVEGKEDALLACLRLGFSCTNPVPQKRPSMKEALQVLEKIPLSPSSQRYDH
ncbi:probable LRR receptor-like serine/threonine-protein kinase At4g37250 [Malania oleifera]|uniref:probable LRR receptor-like serine/threonine-protein kinase At4g37250 n=1 Tax=Malania oleifera TaxID=397392 RepID=UPI0025ADD2C0|nr:probable LRR receptor-like serine/threonine-protein kinase At4g37250 [Malania oleifera]